MSWLHCNQSCVTILTWKKWFIYLSQIGYLDKVLKCFNMEREKALCTLLPSYVKLFLDDCPKFDAKSSEMAKVPYVCYDMYKVNYSICNGSGQLVVVNWYMSNLGKKLWDAMKGAMRYLKGTRELHIWFGTKMACVEGYTIAGYENDREKQRDVS